MKKTTRALVVGASLSAALMVPATSFAACGPLDFKCMGGAITKTANDAAKAGGWVSAAAADATAKTAGFVDAAYAAGLGYADKAALEAYDNAAKVNGFGNAAAAYAKGYTSAAIIETSKAYAVAGGWGSLAAAQLAAEANGYKNLMETKAAGYVNSGQVALHSATAKASGFYNLATADAQAKALGFTSYGARIVNDSKDFTQNEFKNISGTLQSTYGTAVDGASSAYNTTVKTLGPLLKDGTNVMSLLTKQCLGDAKSTYSKMGGPVQTVITNMQSLSRSIPSTSSPKAVPVLTLKPLTPEPTGNSLTAKVAHSAWEVQNQPNRMYNSAATQAYAEQLISYAPPTTGGSAQQAMTRLIRGIGQNRSMDQQMQGDLALVGQAIGLVDATGKRLFDMGSKQQNWGIYFSVGGTFDGAGAGATVAFGVDTIGTTKKNILNMKYQAVNYALLAAGGLQATAGTGSIGPNGSLSAGVFWGNGGIKKSEGAYFQAGGSIGSGEVGLQWVMDAPIIELIKNPPKLNINSIANDTEKLVVDNAVSLFTAACQAPGVNIGATIGTGAGGNGPNGTVQIGYQGIIKSGSF